MPKVCSLFPFKVLDTKVLAGIPWNIASVNAPSFWANANKGQDAVVAVMDTGIDTAHPEFAGRIISALSFSSESVVTDLNGHGTHVAGIVAGTSTGIAPEARVISAKILDKNGRCDNAESIYEAFRHLIQYNKNVYEKDLMKVLNLSWGGTSPDPMIHYFVRKLVNSGVVVVAAAGNAGDGDPSTSEIWNYPGYLYEPLTVGATTQEEQVAGYSNSYDGIDVGAPGSMIYSAWPGGGYKLISGTSMATPHVTGACALIAAAWRHREGRYPTTDELEQVLLKHIKKTSLDPAFVGQGLLDLAWDIKKWPLNRVQVGAYYSVSGQVWAYDRIKALIEAYGTMEDKKNLGAFRVKH